LAPQFPDAAQLAGAPAALVAAGTSLASTGLSAGALVPPQAATLVAPSATRVRAMVAKDSESDIVVGSFRFAPEGAVLINTTGSMVSDQNLIWTVIWP
jgi:hypothetical protein